ncbi:MAG: three-Cys-motif partner protein TcmP [Bdellovibrionales bacterium]|nr:three-Cys-motif partner protein TcmP [Bdellovibrionales bacterium]
MAKQGVQNFGGGWTEDKLKSVQKYLAAYATIMQKQKFKFAYIDAFAGTGYREQKTQDKTSSESLLAADLAGEEPQKFLDGSARVALKVEPRFDRYIFIEKNETRFKELEGLKSEFPDKAKDIQLINADANTFLKDFCNKKWNAHRAVIFLDPYGMQVHWDTIQTIAKTKAIDLWILFPLGSGVSRLLRRDGQIDQAMREKLDNLFGEKDWYDAFYEKKKQQSLFTDEVSVEKVASFKSIEKYFVSRLKTIFPSVAPNPLPLYNSKNVPLFLLCFAAANEKGGPTAVKIARDILRKK